MEFQRGCGNDREKTSGRGEFYPHVDRLGVDCGPRRLEPADPKGIDDERVEHGSRPRPGPRFVHQFGKLDPATANPWVRRARHHDERLLEQYLGVHLILGGRLGQPRNPKLDAALSQ